MINCLPLEKHFCKNISNHVLSRTIDHFESTTFDSVLNEMLLHIDVFGSCMIIVILDEFDGCLVVAI